MSNELPLIYVIDDVSAFREILKNMLEDMGFNNFMEAADGQEALEKLRTHPAALILSDHMMSPMSGLELLKNVKKDSELSKIPFVMVSAVGEKELIDEATSYGLMDYVIKPIRYEQLRNIVIRALSDKMI